MCPDFLSLDHPWREHVRRLLLRDLQRRQTGLAARHDPDALGGLTLGRYFNDRGRRAMQDQLANWPRAPLVVPDDTFVRGVDTRIRVLRADAVCPGLHPKRDDQVIAKGIVIVHVAVEQVLDLATIGRCPSQAAQLAHLRLQCREFVNQVLIDAHACLLSCRYLRMI
jgi:hypothetical protein